MDNLDRVLVVDVDGHVNEATSTSRRACPSRGGRRGPSASKTTRATRAFLEGRIWGTAQGPGPSVTGPFTDKARKGRPGMIDPLQRLTDMDAESIDVAVLFGTQIALTVKRAHERVSCRRRAVTP